MRVEKNYYKIKYQLHWYLKGDNQKKERFVTTGYLNYNAKGRSNIFEENDSLIEKAVNDKIDKNKSRVILEKIRNNMDYYITYKILD
jgi:hypothetical protein